MCLKEKRKDYGSKLSYKKNAKKEIQLLSRELKARAIEWISKDYKGKFGEKNVDVLNVL